MPPDTEVMPIVSGEDIVKVRQAVRACAMELGFSLVEQTKIVTAASELARNAMVYGGGGEVHIERLSQSPKRCGIRLVFEDHGPGIPNVELAMREGYSTGSGLGLGLSGAKKLSHEFEIQSTVGAGTRVTIVRWK